MTIEIPAGGQLADARAAVAAADGRFVQATRARVATGIAYSQARETDPAAQSTDDARRAWAEALHDFIDASVDLERAHDELNAINRQTTVETA